MLVWQCQGDKEQAQGALMVAGTARFGFGAWSVCNNWTNISLGA